MERNVLFVDDEKAILNTFQRSLRGKGFGIFTAEDGPTALSILASQSIDIIISDMRMPTMTGHQLLRQVREIAPSTIRLILSGYVEESESSRAILDGSCKMYLLKPWDSQLLTKTLQHLFDVRTKLRNSTLLEVINKNDGLCSPPHIYTRVTEMIDKDVDTQQVASVLAEDPVIAAKVLHMVNSAFYGIKTGSISQAITYLGLPSVKNIVLSISICQLLPGGSDGLLNKNLLWQHASGTNRLVCELHRKLAGKPISLLASTAGLLHDIGRMALMDQLRKKYIQINELLHKQPDLPLEQVEIELLGVSHQEVGGYLLDWWNLPYEIVESALFHHDPLNQSIENQSLVALVHIASFFALQAASPGIKGTLEKGTFQVLNTSKEEIERIIQQR